MTPGPYTLKGSFKCTIVGYNIQSFLSGGEITVKSGWTDTTDSHTTLQHTHNGSLNYTGGLAELQSELESANRQETLCLQRTKS